ncbi:MAG: flagellar biosynthesis anti-sigma factor FlgM [Synergistetes bacterium]|nr:flagellar biosynthesis anti-sigma factor FlgM [Synergistota bacterium]
MEYGKRVGDIFKTYLEKVKPAKRKIKRTEGSIQSPEDKVEISSTALEVKIAKEAISSVSETRRARVNEIRRLIEEGKYDPPLKEVARKVLKEIYPFSGE